MDLPTVLNEIFYGRAKKIKYVHKMGKVSLISIY